jgi:outer membrane receptor for monomeric catechols
VRYGPFEYGNNVVPFVDYDTLTVYIAATGAEISNHVKIFVFTFNPSNNTFTLQGATQVDEVVVLELYPLPGQLLIRGLTVDSFQAFELVDLSTTLNATVITKYQTNGDFFQDKTGAVYLMIVSDDVYYANQVTSLPGINNSTVSGTAVGLCRYALKDSVSDFSVVGFYNVCSNQALLADIYA